ncbi:MAG: SLC13 family permease, partial [Gammaproteobacteria bacterium]
MQYTLPQAFAKNFLGNSPDWFKLTILAFLVLNPVVFVTLGGYIAGWALVLEFIFTLAMALKCYPLQSGGLLAFEAIAIGLATPEQVFHETEQNFQVILLLIFMVAGIFFLKDLLLYIFTKIVVKIESKTLLSLLFLLTAAVLSAFLDALTVTAVVITVAAGFYAIYHKVASGKQFHHDHSDDDDTQVHELHREDLDQFRAFLRNLMMHAAVGTALGGVTTLVGEPQNLLIAEIAGWGFVEFFVRMAPVSMPVFFVGMVTCVVLEKTRWFGYGAPLPAVVRGVLVDFDREEEQKLGIRQRVSLISQAAVVVFLMLALGFQAGEVGLVGLAVIVLATASTGIVEEHRLGKAFE